MKLTTLPFPQNSIQGQFLSRDGGSFEFKSPAGDYWFGTNGMVVYRNWILYPGPVRLVDFNGNEVHFVGREVIHKNDMCTD